MDRQMLGQVLEYMSTLVEAEFRGIPIKLVAHGGACMLLHRGLHELARHKEIYHLTRNEPFPIRKTTWDVDYIRRGFIEDYVGRFGISDAEQKLQRCIRGTALRFGLGADWMNGDADVALPMSTSASGVPVDSVYFSSIHPDNTRLHTIFTSENQKLVIINVPPAWAVAFKLVRYDKWDPADIITLMMNVSMKPFQTRWSPATAWRWITEECPTMGYQYWDQALLLNMQRNIEHVVFLLNQSVP